MPERIYLDHAATTPIRPEAAAAVAEGMKRWANPSSPHAEGRAARAALEDARARIKAALGWDGELIFTSGASEAIAIALGRAKVARRLVSAVEHDAVFRAAPDATVVPMAEDWQIDRDRLATELGDGGSAILALQHLNSETGTYQPVDAVTAQVRAAGGILLCDCAQSAGKLSLPDADMIVVSAHKLGGPPGIGALLVREFGQLEAGGGQERGYRGGTENLPGALGFAAALEAREPEHLEGVAAWVSDIAMAAADLSDMIYVDRGANEVRRGIRCNWIHSYAMPHLKADAQLILLDREGFAVSAGSACSSGSLKASRTLAAFGVPSEVAERTIRVSFGWNTTEQQIWAFGEAWCRVFDEAMVQAR